MHRRTQTYYILDDDKLHTNGHPQHPFTVIYLISLTAASTRETYKQCNVCLCAKYVNVYTLPVQNDIRMCAVHAAKFFPQPKCPEMVVNGDIHPTFPSRTPGRASSNLLFIESRCWVDISNLHTLQG